MISNDPSGLLHSSRATAAAASQRAPFIPHTLALCLLLAFAGQAAAAPAGGVVAAGAASIATGPGSTTITQTTANASINWQSFGIAAGESVQFKQPSASSVALNRV